MTGDRFQVTDPRFSSDHDPSSRPPHSRSTRSSCLTGCLIVLGIVLLLLVVGTIWTARHWRGWMASTVGTALKMSIDEVDLPAHETAAIHGQIDRVAAAFAERRLTGEQTALILQRLMESPLVTLIAVAAAERRYFDQSDLTDEERIAGRQSLRRFLRGAFDGTIDQNVVDDILRHVAEQGPGGEWRLRRRISDRQLRELLDAARQAADDAAIPNESELASPSQEFKRIIDEALSENNIDLPH